MDCLDGRPICLYDRGGEGAYRPRYLRITFPGESGKMTVTGVSGVDVLPEKNEGQRDRGDIYEICNR